MKPTKSLLAATLALTFVATPGLSWSAESQPVAPVRPVTTTYFGTPVVDRYRYMENLSDPEVQSWMKAQAAYTRKVIDSIPDRASLATHIQELMAGDLKRYDFTRRGDRLFYHVLEPGTNLPKLAYRDGVKGEEHVLVDPAKLSTDSAHHFALDWYSPSWDGRYVAYGVSEGGSEKSVLHVIDLQTGSQLQETIDRTSDCFVSWRNDNKSFFYLRYPKAGPDTPPSLSEYNAVTFLHVLGQHTDGEGDEAVFGRGVSASVDVPEGQATYVLLAPDSPYAVAVANHNVDNNPNTFYVARLDQIHGAQTPWKKIATPEDGVTDVRLRGDRLYVLSDKGAPRFQILSTPLAHPDIAHANVVVPESENVLDAFEVASDGMYLGERAGATFELRHVSYDGKDNQPIGLPFAGTVSDLATDPRSPGLLFSLQGWVKAPRELSYAPGASAATDTGLVPPSKTESDDIEAHDEFATSYDGTRIPVSIIAKKGVTRDGTNPTIVYGYGSYGISMDPSYRPAWQGWIDRGGIIAVAHMRGGGEYGDAWHRAGQKLTKINTMMDFIATAQHMIDERYTQSKYLAANSASAGGIVMGGAMEINPGLFRVILDDVGLSDALRFETEPNGPPNVPEMGSSSNEAGFHGLYAMSAYAHIHDGTPYPAVMFTTGANDPRVAPWHMLKMAARTQAATSSGRPVLLRIDYDAGHGIGSSVSQRANQLADEWSFALWQMGEAGFQPKQ
ncbi:MULTISPECIES: prolyl oligopeptidase family serine peptidase [Paraburkholderia]|uniref:prolyl oligopeptidase family serine peptidase n=1 Tax=Paraburkholderia TaxID=1822464 RepID=UPI002257F2EA|nr:MULTISPECIES: prolyl oligopeptidase family serine peptidase [Paraburkholderia]MCX4162865.1 prolyl oligopeptidase family serine peptidase [Paraburkholderia megapolitana]MDN7158361.1 prolyl oligopeptidase family serine peptidase [Paraburkholderia sp. CHISQ3]MDQ6495408.1 prolyl oligopeptidase family serine peptidase [Paraburkholderia megapolitana]